ncbi:exported hypothetical protein [Streptomyces misionensis JCM 4497]
MPPDFLSSITLRVRVRASARFAAPVICSTAVRRKANRFCRKNTNPWERIAGHSGHGKLRVSDIGHRA